MNCVDSLFCFTLSKHDPEEAALLGTSLGSVARTYRGLIYSETPYRVNVRTHKPVEGFRIHTFFEKWFLMLTISSTLSYS